MRYQIGLSRITAVAVALMLPGILTAQQPNRWAINGRAGVAVPAGNLSDFEKVGANGALGLSYALNPHFALRVDGAVDALKGRDNSDQGVLVDQVPDLTLWHFLGGVQAFLNPRNQSRWNLSADLEAGSTYLRSSPDIVFASVNTNDRFSKGYFSGNGGIRLDYKLTPEVNVDLGGQANYIATKKFDTGVFDAFSSDVDPDGFNNAWTFPIQAGVNVKF